jgi:hypothetical protein
VDALREIRGVLGAVWFSRSILEVAVVFVAVVGLALSNGGFFPHAWTVAAAGLFSLIALSLLLGEDFQLGRLDRAWLSLLVGLIGWTALSIVWSENPSATLDEVRRGLVYVAALGAVLLFAGSRSVFRLVAANWAACAAVVAYALLLYLLRAGSRVDPFQAALLFRPLGYANALGILAGIGTVLAVGLTANETGTPLGMLSAASVSPFAATLFLTGSRGSSVAAAVGLTAMFVVERDRPSLVAALCVLAPGAAVIVALSDRSSLVDQTISGARATHAGYLLLAAIVVVGAAMAVASRAIARISGWIRGRPFAHRLLAAAAFVTIVVGVVVAGRGWRDHFTNEGYRPTYWHVAWIEYRAHPWLGSGAGTFGDYWLRLGIPGAAGGALDAHNLYLETLAEVGPVGLALLVATLAVPLVATVGVRRRPFVPVALGGYSALLAHAALDWDWEVPAVMLAGLFCGAAIIACAREPAPQGTLSPRARLGVLAAACGFALFALLAQTS